MLVRMGAQRVEAIPGTEKAQVDALKDAIRLYQELLDEKEQPDPDLYARLGFTLSYLGNRQMGLGRPDQAESNSHRGLKLLDNLPGEPRNKRTWHQSAFARYVLGKILAAKNERAEAERLYREACDILTPLDGDAETRDLLGYCYTGLGTLSNNPDRNREHCRRAMELSAELHKKDPDNWYYRHRYGDALYNLARNGLFSGRLEEAEALFQRCIALLAPFVGRASNTNEQPAARLQSQITLFHCYEGLGMLWSNRGQFDKAESFYRKAIAVSEQLVQLYPHPDRRQELAQSYLNLGATYQLSQQTKKAAEVYRKAIPILEALVHDLPDLSLYRLSLAGCYANIALIGDGTHGDEALPALQRGREVLEPFLQAHPEDSRFAMNYGNLCNNQALTLLYRGEARKALPWHDRAVEVLRDAHRRHPSEAECTDWYASFLAARAQTWTALQEHKTALADWDRVVEVVVPVEGDKYRFWRANTLILLGDHRQAAEDIAKVLRRPDISQDQRYLCVDVLSHALAVAENDPQLSAEQRQQAADIYAARALEVLTQLRRDGYFRDFMKWLKLAMDADLAALRSRKDFKRWLLKPPNR
ncbi:MAG: tetratricopeptide repeat protein [Gemmataceae bacterium]